MTQYCRYCCNLCVGDANYCSEKQQTMSDADIDCKGMCGRYEKEIAEMFLKSFDDSEEKISCNCKHNSNSRENEPCCRCDSRQTNADRIRNMSDEELASWYVIKCEIMMGIKCKKPYKTCKDCILQWLQSEAE